jgi:hypothetical protein
MVTARKEAKVLYLRGTPDALLRKLKAAAALDGKSLQTYLMEVLHAHVADLERKGHLPKSR